MNSQLPCADEISLAPPTDGDAHSILIYSGVLKLRHCCVSVNMAGIVANKCRSSLTFLTRTLSAPEFFTQCCYHKKVKHERESLTALLAETASQSASSSLRMDKCLQIFNLR